MRTIKIYSLRKYQVYNMILLTAVTMLYLNPPFLLPICIFLSSSSLLNNFRQQNGLYPLFAILQRISENNPIWQGKTLKFAATVPSPHFLFGRIDCGSQGTRLLYWISEMEEQNKLYGLEVCCRRSCM